ncbi:MAG: hypothetical protein HPY59_16110 [Anaerolineae bacterium]|nr:hypothetical protein [Anaerolineae bacterium]
MTTETVFQPPRQTGLLIHGGLAILLLGGSAVSLIAALNREAGSYFVLLLLLSLGLLPPAALAVYRGYALLQASYTLERDGLRLRWGLRGEDIPLSEIEWVRPATDLGYHLPLPPFAIPGAILGKYTLKDLGVVEFIASETTTLLLVATPERIFAISPEDPNRFMRNFQRAMELGSLTPLESHSTVPAAFLQRIWADRAARYMLMAGLGLTLILFILTGIAIPSLNNVSLGYDLNAQPLEPAAPERLLLLPTLAAMTLTGDLILGMYFYRKVHHRPAAYLLWSSGIITPALLIVAVLIILI